MRIIVTLFLGVSLAGCLGAGGGDGEGGLVGDWFVCMDADCTSVDDDGVRFAADGTWAELEGDDQVLTGEPICVVVDRAGGTYSFSDDQLALTDDRGTMERPAMVHGDRLTLPSVDGEEETLLVRVETVEMAVCPDDDPPQGLGSDADLSAPDPGP